MEIISINHREFISRKGLHSRYMTFYAEFRKKDFIWKGSMTADGRPTTEHIFDDPMHTIGDVYMLVWYEIKKWKEELES